MGHEFGPDLLSADVEIGLQFDALLLGFGYSASLKVNLEVMNYLLDEENLVLLWPLKVQSGAVDFQADIRVIGELQNYLNIIERDGRISDECFHESEEVLDALVLLGFAEVHALIYRHALSSYLLTHFRELL